jgi:hypothetical protein
MRTSDVGQVVGYFMVPVTVPEALLARHIREQPVLYASVISLLVPIGSFLWVLILGFIVGRKYQKKPS